MTCHVYVTVCVCDMSCLCHSMCVWHVMFMSLYVCVRYVYITVFVWNMVRSPFVCGRSCFKSLSVWNVMFKSPCVCVYARWVSGLEAVAPLLNKGLSYLLHVSKKKRKCENFCFLPVSQHKHVTGSLQPPHGLFWVKGSSLCCCPFPTALCLSLFLSLSDWCILSSLPVCILSYCSL